jgi:hypothetical protein
MTVFRIHIRPKGCLGNSEVSFNYCLKANVLGLGWQTKSQNNNCSWDEYYAEAKNIYGKGELSRVCYLKKKIQTDNLIWTRCPKGEYYLAKVISNWEYLTNPEAQAADIVNIVRCNILKVQDISQVPGKVIACFRPSRTIQSIQDKTTIEYSKQLWNAISKTNHFQASLTDKNVFSLFSSEETEDIVFIHLQLNDWIVIPNSRKLDTMSYEFYAIHRQTKEKAIVQVKTGNTPINPKDWENRSEKVFLFQSSGNYISESSSENIICFTPDYIENFLRNNKDIYPSNIVHWLNITTPNQKL